MQFNQILLGLNDGHSYRKVEWSDGTYIRRDDDDHVNLFHNKVLTEKQWSPSQFDAADGDWLAIDALTAPLAPEKGSEPTLIPMLNEIPIGARLVFDNVDNIGRDIAFFSPENQKLVFQYVDSNGDTLPSETCVKLMIRNGWRPLVISEPDADLLVPPIAHEEHTSAEVTTMKLSNEAEILELCKPLQERLQQNTSFVRIEIPVADTGIKHLEKDVSLLISVTAESIKTYLHCEGVNLSNEELGVEHSIERHLLTGAIAQRVGKPLSAIAVPDFVIEGHHELAGGEEPVRENVLSFDTSIVSETEPELKVELGIYHVFAQEDKLFNAYSCEGGVVYGVILPHHDGAEQQIISLDLFLLLFRRLPKLTAGTKLRNSKSGANVTLTRIDPIETTAVVDLGLSSAEILISSEELKDDSWEFVSYDPDFTVRKETVVENAEA